MVKPSLIEFTDNTKREISATIQGPEARKVLGRLVSEQAGIRDYENYTFTVTDQNGRALNNVHVKIVSNA